MVSLPIGGGVLRLERSPGTLDHLLQEKRPAGGGGPFRLVLMGEAPRFREAPYGEERFPMWLCARKLCYARMVV